MLKNESLKNFIEEVLLEVQKELDEENVTGNIDGYQTPHAFSGKNASQRRKKTATQLGYTLVNNDVENIDESINEGLKHLIHVETPKEILSKSVAKQIITLAKKGVRSNEIGLNMGFIGNNNAAVNAFQRVKNKIYFDLHKNESINENRWLAIKNDESMHAHKKLAMGLKELKYQLSEVEKFFNWYNKIKNINELESSDYWKRTNNHIYKIKERIVNIARTLKEIEK
jgi:hypothetical protein